MPAEWEPHEATWLSWPHNLETWPGNFEPVPPVFAEMVAALSPDEEVRILAGTEDLERSARAELEARRCDLSNVRFFRIPTNDAWMRDHGPIFVKDAAGAVAITDWGYNAWGGKYPPFDRDDRVLDEGLRHLGSGRHGRQRAHAGLAHGPFACDRGGVDELLGCQAPVRRRRMQMEIDHTGESCPRERVDYRCVPVRRAAGAGARTRAAGRDRRAPGAR